MKVKDCFDQALSRKHQGSLEVEVQGLGKDGHKAGFRSQRQVAKKAHCQFLGEALLVLIVNFEFTLLQGHRVGQLPALVKKSHLLDSASLRKKVGLFLS